MIWSARGERRVLGVIACLQAEHSRLARVRASDRAQPQCGYTQFAFPYPTILGKISIDPVGQGRNRWGKGENYGFVGNVQNKKRKSQSYHAGNCRQCRLAGWHRQEIFLGGLQVAIRLYRGSHLPGAGHLAG